MLQLTETSYSSTTETAVSSDYPGECVCAHKRVCIYFNSLVLLTFQ